MAIIKLAWFEDVADIDYFLERHDMVIIVYLRTFFGGIR